MIAFLQVVYLLCALWITVYSFGYLVLLVQYLIHRHSHHPLPDIAEYPKVLVQLPLYNEQHVVERLLDAVNALDYPRDRLSVQVLDDSTDETARIVADKVASLRRLGLDIQQVRRENRVGYKAGALAYGLTLSDAEYVAIFDADFVPPHDFLTRTIPHFVAHPKVGIVQARWGSLNADESILTQAQALNIDVHFVIEQLARNRSNLLVTFNGTGGIWRRACIDDAGGWSWDTLTEDLDLSYRAQFKGWKYIYLPDLVVPGEVPPLIDAYKRQQARWSKGTTQVLIKLFPKVWRQRLSVGQRAMAIQNWMQYIPSTILLTMFLLTPPLIASRALLNLPFMQVLALIGIVPPLMHVFAQMSVRKDWLPRLRYLPFVVLLGSGLIWNNARAAFGAFYSRIKGTSGEFVRTPKFGKDWAKSGYAFGKWSSWGELALCLYGLYGTWLASRFAPSMTIYMLVYALSFGLVVVMSARDYWQVEQARQASLKSV